MLDRLPIVVQLGPVLTDIVYYNVTDGRTNARILHGCATWPTNVRTTASVQAGSWQHHPLVGVDGRWYPGRQRGTLRK
jgi:hypothetical protein